MYAHAADICSAGRLLTVKIDGFRRPPNGASRHVRSLRKPTPSLTLPGTIARRCEYQMAGHLWARAGIAVGARSQAPTARPRRGTSRLRPRPGQAGANAHSRRRPRAFSERSSWRVVVAATARDDGRRQYIATTTASTTKLTIAPRTAGSCPPTNKRSAQRK